MGMMMGYININSCGLFNSVVLNNFYIWVVVQLVVDIVVGFIDVILWREELSCVNNGIFKFFVFYFVECQERDQK